MLQTGTAGFFRRLLAVLIDNLIVTVVTVAVINVISAVLPAEGSSAGMWVGVLAGGLVLIGSAYTVIFWILRGATPGKIALRIKIIGADGGRLSIGKALVRFLALFLSAAPALIGYLRSLLDPERKTWHDLLSGTRVVMDGEYPGEDVEYLANGLPVLKETRGFKGDTLRAWCLLAVPLFFLLLFIWVPVFQTVVRSFFKENLANNTGRFVGFDNYASVFTEPLFLSWLWNSFRLSLLSPNMLLFLPGPLGAAFLLVKFNNRGADTAVRILFSLILVTAATVAMTSMFKIFAAPPPIGFLDSMAGYPVREQLLSQDTAANIIDMSQLGIGLAVVMPLGLILYLASLKGSLMMTPDGGSVYRGLLSGAWKTAAILLIAVSAFFFQNFTSGFLMTGGKLGSTLIHQEFRYSYQMMNFNAGAVYGIFILAFLIPAGILTWFIAERSVSGIYVSDQSTSETKPVRGVLAGVIAGLSAVAVVFLLWNYIVYNFLPSLNAFFMSFKRSADVFKAGSLFPPQFSLEAYQNLQGHSKLLDGLFNSISTILPATVLQLVLSVMGGYALGRLRPHGRRIITFFIMAGLYILPGAVISSNFIMMYRAGLVNTHLGLILPWLGCPIGIILFKMFFEGYRIDLARMKLAPDEQAGKAIVKAAAFKLAGMGTFTALALMLVQINSFYISYILGAAKVHTLEVELYTLSMMSANSPNLVAAAVVFSLLPMILLATALIVLQIFFLPRVRILAFKRGVKRG
ncbi:MAG: RDD family protein [Spirochaetales bacterium]|nr:RDD family protein [Spirochaetales bacterium]